MKYVATVHFLDFEVGEIVDIPENNDLPRSYFDQGFFVSLDEWKELQNPIPKEKSVSKAEVTFNITNGNATTATGNTGTVTYTTTNSTKATKPDKLD